MQVALAKSMLIGLFFSEGLGHHRHLKVLQKTRPYKNRFLLLVGLGIIKKQLFAETPMELKLI